MDHSINDWITHSLLLCQRRAEQASGEELRVLRRELMLRRHVMNVLPEDLAGSAQVFRHYIVAHARLQQARYSGAITEKDFRHRAGRLLQWRNDEDAKVRHLPWRNPRAQSTHAG